MGKGEELRQGQGPDASLWQLIGQSQRFQGGGCRGDTGVQMKDQHHRHLLGHSRDQMWGWSSWGKREENPGSPAGRYVLKNRTEAEAQVSAGERMLLWGVTLYLHHMPARHQALGLRLCPGLGNSFSAPTGQAEPTYVKL